MFCQGVIFSAQKAIFPPQCETKEIGSENLMQPYDRAALSIALRLLKLNRSWKAVVVLMASG